MEKRGKVLQLEKSSSTGSSEAHLEDEWIVSAQSVQQRRIIAALKEETKVQIYDDKQRKQGYRFMMIHRADVGGV